LDFPAYSNEKSAEFMRFILFGKRIALAAARAVPQAFR
jgi:hypothetical protein